MMTRVLQCFAIFAFSIMTLFVASCDVSDKLDDLNDIAENAAESTESVLRDAVDSLERNSSSWQSTLQSAINKLTDDAQSTIRNELSNLMQRGIAATGAEFRCDADFIGDRTRQALERILAGLTGGEVSPVIAGICSVVPLAIDRELIPARLRYVEFYGYDFDQGNISARLIDSNGNRNVTTHLDKPTHYHMTLNLGGNGVPLSDKSKRIIVKSGDMTLSTLAVIQEPTPICETKDETYSRANYLTYQPPHTNGDKEFAGHGPTVTATVEWINHGDRVDVRMYMKAKETKKDWTTAAGSTTRTYYTPPAGWRVESINGDVKSSYQYIDNDHTEDHVGMGPGGPVNEFVFRGDTKGQDAGVYSGVDVTFNPLQMKLVQIADCVSPDEVKSLQRMKLISPDLMKKMNLKLVPFKIVDPNK